MGAQELFSAGTKLIGVYFVASGICMIPSLLPYVEIPSDWKDARAIVQAVLYVSGNIGVGWYLIGGAPLLTRLAGFERPAKVA